MVPRKMQDLQNYIRSISLLNVWGWGRGFPISLGDRLLDVAADTLTYIHMYIYIYIYMYICITVCLYVCMYACI